MGTDIHCFVEYRRKGLDEGNNPFRWQPFVEVDPGRDYWFFGRIAGIRGGTALVPPRGFPKDAGYASFFGNTLRVVDGLEAEGYCSREDAESWGGHYAKLTEEDGGMDYCLHPDWHGHTWLSTDERAEATKVGAEEREKIAAEHRENMGFGARLYEELNVANDASLQRGWERIWKRSEEDAVEEYLRSTAGYRAVTAAMRSLEGEGFEVRIVVWFDN